MMKLGFIVNPIAGMGGSVGLKGTDGMLQEAIRRGAKQVAPQRALQFLKALKKKGIEAEIYTASGKMGYDECREAGIKASIVYEAGEETTAKDTINACREFLKHGVAAIAFVGGDGTARDVYSIVGKKAAIIGVPAGVKMYSAVFALTPEKAAEALKNANRMEEREIVDIDEEAFRRGKLKTKIFGYALTFASEEIQFSKGEMANVGKEEIAEWIVENMEKDITYIIGGGTTTWEIKKAIGISGSLLGIDVVRNSRLLCKDASEKCVLKHTDEKTKIIVSPLGKSGFIFGRGNQPISWRVIEKVGKNGIIIVATKDKLLGLDSLKVDTGNEKINRMLRGYIRVITGYNESMVMRVV